MLIKRYSRCIFIRSSIHSMTLEQVRFHWILVLLGFRVVVLSGNGFKNETDWRLQTKLCLLF